MFVSGRFLIQTFWFSNSRPSSVRNYYWTKNSNRQNTSKQVKVPNVPDTGNITQKAQLSINLRLKIQVPALDLFNIIQFPIPQSTIFTDFKPIFRFFVLGWRNHSNFYFYFNMVICICKFNCLAKINFMKKIVSTRAWYRAYHVVFA